MLKDRSHNTSHFFSAFDPSPSPNVTLKTKEFLGKKENFGKPPKKCDVL